MKENYTISLKVLIFLIALGVLHTVARILGGLGLVSDLFTVLGAYMVWQNVKTSEARQRVIRKVDQVIDVDDVGELLSEKTKQLKVQVQKIKKPSDVPAFDLTDFLSLGNEEEKVRDYTPPTNFKAPMSTEEVEEQFTEDLPDNPPVIEEGIGDFSNGSGI